MDRFKEFRFRMLNHLKKYAEDNNYLIYTSDGISNHKLLNDEYPEDEFVLYWICKEMNRLLYVRFTKVSDDNFYIFIDNKSISLMLDNNFKRLTSYPSKSFNIAVDRMLDDNATISKVLDFMIKDEIMLNELFKAYEK